MIPADVNIPGAVNATIQAATSMNILEGIAVWNPLAKFVLGVIVYSLFIFKFYRFLAKKDIFELNLNQYNKAKHAVLKKFFSCVFYLIEYVLLFPILAFFWFLVLTSLMIFLAKNQPVESILLASICLVSAVRITSYLSEDLSRDLAKMLPFALLGLFLVDASFFSFANSVQMLKSLPSKISSMFYYLAFIVCVEFIMRIGHGILKAIFSKKESSSKT